MLLKAGSTDGLCASNAFRVMGGKFEWKRWLPLPKFKKNHKNFSPLNPRQIFKYPTKNHFLLFYGISLASYDNKSTAIKSLIIL